MKIRGVSVLGWILAVAVTLSIAGLSNFPYAAAEGEAALIRLSWRARGERVEECRQLSEEEQRSLPQHMRRLEICEGKIATYLLTAKIDGIEVLRDTIRGSGARQDRPLYVHYDLPVNPGARALRVGFVRLGQLSADTLASLAVPRRLELDTLLTPSAGTVLLVTYHAEERRLIVRDALP
jgi:hypothetical protein